MVNQFCLAANGIYVHIIFTVTPYVFTVTAAFGFMCVITFMAIFTVNNVVTITVFTIGRTLCPMRLLHNKVLKQLLHMRYTSA